LTPEELQQIERLCLEALDLPASSRGAFLEAHCPDPKLRQEVRALLEAESAAERIFDPTPVDPPLSGPPLSDPPLPGPPEGELDEELGDTEPYEILNKLGEGGMGLVFRARQSSPVHREVALKVIRPGMASLQLIERFRRERQALAIMEHPNIARVFDAGATSRGLPYLVMELVNGSTIQTYCDNHNFSTTQRIALMIPVCQAIQHAHSKGIIHRDIKPSNVLVTEFDSKPVPKVIDFGIAKAIETAQSLPAGATRPGTLVGTFEYLSPEQAEPGLKDIDTRTDIYSLGALIYLLVTGQAPLEGLNLERSSYNEILRRIQQEAPSPATRVRPPLAKLDNSRELDWILAKALEKDRERRYTTADALAQDLQRFLDGEPVEAGPPSRSYRLRKLAQRYKYAVAAAAALVLTLFLAIIVLAFALNQQRRANTNALALREVVRKFLIERPGQLALEPNRTALRGQLMRDAEGALEALSQDPNPNEALQLDLAQAYFSIGLAKGAYTTTGSEGDSATGIRYLNRSIALFNQLCKTKPNDRIRRGGQLAAISSLLYMQRRLERDADFEKSAQDLISTISQVPPDLREAVFARSHLSSAYQELGSVRWRQGRHAEALELHDKAVQVFLDRIPEPLRKRTNALDRIAHLQGQAALSRWLYLGYQPGMEAGMERAIAELATCTEPNCRLRHAEQLGLLGQIHWAAGHVQQGIRLLSDSVRLFEESIANDPANKIYRGATPDPRRYLTQVLAQDGQAAAAMKSSLTLDLSPAQGATSLLINNTARAAALIAAKQYGSATELLRQSIAKAPPNTPNDMLWSAHFLLGQSLEASLQWDAAHAVRQREWDLAQAATGDTLATRVRKALSARNLAATRNATPAERQQSLAYLATKPNLNAPYGILVGALLLRPPLNSQQP
jgi:serine/threonine protein kinase